MRRRYPNTAAGARRFTAGKVCLLACLLVAVPVGAQAPAPAAAADATRFTFTGAFRFDNTASDDVGQLPARGTAVSGDARHAFHLPPSVIPVRIPEQTSPLDEATTAAGKAATAAKDTAAARRPGSESARPERITNSRITALPRTPGEMTRGESPIVTNALPGRDDSAADSASVPLPVTAPGAPAGSGAQAGDGAPDRSGGGAGVPAQRSAAVRPARPVSSERSVERHVPKHRVPAAARSRQTASRAAVAPKAAPTVLQPTPPWAQRAFDGAR